MLLPRQDWNPPWGMQAPFRRSWKLWFKPFSFAHAALCHSGSIDRQLREGRSPHLRSTAGATTKAIPTANSLQFYRRSW
ncbi:MAG: hypothetical protein IPJ74_15090 [Saprospiraceae bacterium]|nr:hypothetical protein [Saprospiraceae bacterium]